MRRPRAFSFGRRWLPVRDEMLVARSACSAICISWFAQLLDVVGIGRAAPVALPLRLAGLQFHAPVLVGHQAGPRPEIVRLLGQQMPAQNGQLARHGNGGDLVAAPGADADEEGMQRPRRLGCRPGRFDQHGAGMAAADLADPAVVGSAEPRLADPRVQAEVADQLLRGC